jgi:N-acetylglucosamine-6-phosphate deacetylase
MATLVPATIAGVAQHKGSIAPGADADLLALNEDGFVHRAWLRGLPAYQKAPERDGAALLRKGTN